MRDLNDFKYQLAQQGVTIERESGRIVLDRNYTIKINGHDINVSSVDKASLTINKPIENSDQAGLAAPGGIDLNSRNLNMQSEGQKVNITFDAAMIAQFRRGDFSGVRIQILDVVPISLVPLLGLKEDEETGKLAKA